jgi:hypothetical protein
VLACDEQDVTETGRGQVPGLRHDLPDRERHAQNRVVAREAAVLAIVNAFVAQVEGREEPHGAPELADRLRAGTRREGLERRIRARLQQPRKRAAGGEGIRFPLRQDSCK